MICLFPFAFTARKWLRISVHVVNMLVSTASACERDDHAIEKQNDCGQYLCNRCAGTHRSRYIDVSMLPLRCTVVTPEQTLSGTRGVASCLGRYPDL
jgi:hypothetical protein